MGTQQSSYRPEFEYFSVRSIVSAALAVILAVSAYGARERSRTPTEGRLASGTVTSLSQ